MSEKIKVILMISITTILVSGVWGFILYQKNKSITAKFEGELSQLTATLDALGPDVDCYTVTEEYAKHYDNDTVGQAITENALQVITVPSSLVGDSYVTDKSKIVGKYFKINVKPGTPITTDLVMGELYDDTLRDVDISVNSWVVGMRVGDYVDLNITLPYGQDYVAIPHKRIQSIGDKTVKMYLTEEEWHTYHSALTDYYLHSQEGIRLYFKKYVEPGIQPKAIPYYAPSDAVRTAMLQDPNIVDKAQIQIQSAFRPPIDGILNEFITDQTTVQGQSGLLAGGRSAYSGDVQSDFRAKQQDKENNANNSEEEDDSYQEEEVVVNFDKKPAETKSSSKAETKPAETEPQETEATTEAETAAPVTEPDTVG